MARTAPARCTLLTSAPGVAMAVEPLDRISFSAGSYLNRFDTELRADGHVTGGGTTIDLSVTWAWIPATSSLSPG